MERHTNTLTQTSQQIDCSCKIDTPTHTDRHWWLMDRFISANGLWIGGRDVICGSMEVDRWIGGGDTRF